MFECMCQISNFKSNILCLQWAAMTKRNTKTIAPIGQTQVVALTASIRNSWNEIVRSLVTIAEHRNWITMQHAHVFYVLWSHRLELNKPIINSFYELCSEFHCLRKLYHNSVMLVNKKFKHKWSCLTRLGNEISHR